MSNQTVPTLPDDVKALYPFQSRFLDLPDGNRVHYVDEGEGEPVVFVHGNPTWSFLYRRFVDHFRATHRAVALDHIGFGLSSKPHDQGYFSLERHVENFGALMEHLGLSDVTLVMQDWGGPISMGWALQHSDRVKRLVVLDTALGVTKIAAAIPWWFRVMRKRPIGEFLYGRLNFFVRGFVERIGTKRSLTEAETTAYRLPFRSAAERAGVIAFPRLIPSRPGDMSYELFTRIEDALPGFQQPALVVWADSDPAFSQEVGRQTAALLPNAEGPHFVEASHYLQEDAPDAIIEHMDRFFAEHP